MTSWLQAWSSYCGVILAHCLDRAPELVAYQALITQASRRYRFLAVLEYDARFRQSAVHHQRPWDVIDNHLYGQVFTGQTIPTCLRCKKPGHLASTCSARLPSSTSRVAITSTPMTKPGVCRRFNIGHCSYPACRYSHACSTCGGSHSAALCSSRS